jgi:hypothetical protein
MLYVRYVYLTKAKLICKKQTHPLVKEKRQTYPLVREDVT